VKKTLVDYLVKHWKLSVNRSCELVELHRSTFYQPPQSDEDQALRSRLNELAQDHPYWGFWKMFYRLRQEGVGANHKRVHRIYCELGLNRRAQARSRCRWVATASPVELYNGEKPLVLFIWDARHKKLTLLQWEIISQRGGTSLIRQLNQLLDSRERPDSLCLLNGPISSALETWASEQYLPLTRSVPRALKRIVTTWQNRFQEEVLDYWEIVSLPQLKRLTGQWLNDQPEEALISDHG